MTRGAMIGWGVVLAGLAAVFAFVPPMAQDPAYHLFADARAFIGIANFADVASNAAFVPVGLYGLWVTARRVRGPARSGLLTFFAGVALVAPGSAYYHLDPDNLTLFWDRLPMAVAFTGLLAAVVSERMLAPRHAWTAVAVAVALGVGSVVHWRLSEAAGAGDLRAYALVQFGSMLAIVAVMAATSAERAVIGWRAVLGAAVFYALAKAGEHFDAALFQAMGGVLSGHTLKHLCAALAPLAVALTLARQGLGAASPSRSSPLRSGAQDVSSSSSNKMREDAPSISSN